MENWKRTFLIIWTGQLFSILSSSIVGYSVVFWLSIETGSAHVLAISTIAAMLPQAVIGLFAGVFIDRWNRKIVMIISDLYIAICTIILAAMFYWEIAEIWHIYLLLALRSVGAAFHGPALQASIPLLAPKSKLMRIAGINQTILSACSIAGPILGALFITLMDMSFILLIDVIGAILAIVSLSLICIPKPKTAEQKKVINLLKDMREAFDEILKHRGLSGLIIISMLATFFIMPIASLFPLMTLQHFMGSTMQMSYVEVAWGTGMLAGGAIVSLINSRTNKIVIINAMYIAFGITILLSGLLNENGFNWFLLLSAIGGISWALNSSAFTVVLQTRIDPTALGRVFSFTMSISILPSILGLIGAGYTADAIGLVNMFIIAGATNIFLGIFSFLLPSNIHLRKSEMV